MKNDPIFALGDHVVSRSEGNDKVIVLDLNKNSIFEIDGLSSQVFESIDGKRSANKIISKISKERNLPDARFKKDSLKFFATLQKLKLIYTVK